MGTRGAYGFYSNGISKIAYNQFDSYPTGLGEAVKTFLAGKPDLKAIFDRIILVTEQDVPSKEDIREYEAWTDLRVSSQRVTDWYCLLRKAQGDLQAFNNGVRHIIDADDFLKDSLFCEFGYVINLDNNKVEVYKGFQKVKDKKSRYQADKSNDGYWHCKMAMEIPIDDFINMDMFDLQRKLN